MSRTAIELDWERLTNQAAAATAYAYVPYSHYPVGAAAIAADGRLLMGANVENASYGLTLCAECSLVSQLIMTGGGRLTHFVCVDGNGSVMAPCGRCRQLLWEHGGPHLRILTPTGESTLGHLLPEPWGLDDLKRGPAWGEN
ncbi:MAG: cytidine deaminase [Bifidobacteriaceae bacterium]|jgi:cytidine deaminase|nr:cytidine deaminase [Bifidobacteriaceae bacterium]